MLKKETEVLLAWEGIYLVKYIDHLFWMFNEKPDRDSDSALGYLERQPKRWIWEHNWITTPRLQHYTRTADEAVTGFLEAHKQWKEQNR